MSKKGTVISRILDRPFDVRLEALDKLLRNYGFECRRVAGVIGHLLYKRPGACPLVIPQKQVVKSCYLKQVLKLLQELIEPDDDLVRLWLKRLNITLVYPTPVN